MKFKFNSCSQEEKERIKLICNTIKTCSAPDLMIRISMHKPHTRVLSDGSTYTYYRATRKHGYYKNYFDHGLYESEVEGIFVKKNCSHIIQLHLTDNETNTSIAKVFAHEWRHYLQFTKLRNRFIGDDRKRKKRIELDARKWADKRIVKCGYDPLKLYNL